MKILRLLSLALFLCPIVGWTVEIIPIQHRVVADNRTFVRNAEDRRYSIWTDDNSKVGEIISEFGLLETRIMDLAPGEVFAVFLNDRIEEDLVQLAKNKSTNQYFADYADSGIKFRLRRLAEDKKFTHVTAVIFSPSESPSHLGMRGMISNGRSEKR